MDLELLGYSKRSLGRKRRYDSPGNFHLSSAPNAVLLDKFLSRLFDLKNSFLSPKFFSIMLIFSSDHRHTEKDFSTFPL